MVQEIESLRKMPLANLDRIVDDMAEESRSSSRSVIEGKMRVREILDSASQIALYGENWDDMFVRKRKTLTGKDFL